MRSESPARRLCIEGTGPSQKRRQIKWAEPSCEARLSDLRWVRARWEGAEKDTCFVDEFGEAASAALGPENVVELSSIAEVALAGVGMTGAVREDVSEGIEGLVGRGGR